MRIYIRDLFIEMSTSRSKAEDEISWLAPQIMKHLIKIIKWKDESNFNKHVSDLDQWLLKIQDIKLKPNNKRVKEEDYYKWLYLERVEDVQKWVRRDLHKYNELPVLVDNNKLIEKLRVLYQVLCKDLHNDDFYSINSYNIIKT